MFRSDDLLLARLVLIRNPGAREAVRKLLRAATSDDGSGRSAFAQALIKRKVIAPTDFVAIQQDLESARRRCAGCRRAFFALALGRDRKVRCPRCKQRTPIPARVTAAGPVSARDETREVMSPIGPRGSTKPGKPRSADKLRTGGSDKPKRDTRKDSEPANPTTQNLPARIGPYAVESAIAQGGMGIVYRAYDPRAKRRVALKVLRGDASDDVAARFKREAEAIARLKHPGIVGIHDAGVDRGMRYFTMDLVEGDDLETAFASGKLGPEDVARIAADLGDALHHAHERGIIHRDVKPQNVLVPRGTTKARLTDFGLARDLARSGLTEDGDLVGTPYYMAPEQFTTGDCDRRTDVYALGTLLYRGLTGVLPFDARTLFELKSKVTEEKPARLSERKPGVPADLERIVLKALEKHPEDRYPTAADLAKDLRAYLSGSVVQARPTAAPRRALRLLGQRSVQVGLVVGVGVLSLGASTWIIVDARNKQDAKQQQAEQERRDALARLTVSSDRAAEAVRAGFEALGRADAPKARERFDEALREVDLARKAIAPLGEKDRKDAEPGLRANERAARRGRLESLAAGEAEDRARARQEAEALLAEDTKDADALVTLGRLELEGGRFRAALDALGRALVADASRLDALYLRGETYRRAGQPAFAIVDLEKALAAEGAGLRRVTRDVVLAARARARLADGNREGAARDVEEALRAAPRSADGHAARADLLRAQGDLDGALSELELACAIQPRRGELRRERGELRALLGDRDRAVEDLDAALELDPRDRGAAALRARLRSLALDDEGAERDVKLALEPGPDDDPASLAWRHARLVQARLARVSGKPEVGLAALDVALPADRKETSAAELPLRLERVEVLLDRPVAANVEAAARELDLIAANHPLVARVLRDAGRAALLRKDGAAAKERLERALELDGRDGIARALLARALRLLGREADARAEEERAAKAQRAYLSAAPPAVAVGPPEDDAAELLDLGRRLLARTRTPEPRDLERAVRAFTRAAQLAPELTAVHVALAEAHRTKDSLDDALRALEEGARVAPRSVEHLALRARILAARGDRDAALEAYELALAAAKGEPGHVALRAQLHLERGRARLDRGDAKGALPDLDAAITLDPVMLEAFAAREVAQRILGNAELALRDKERVQLLDKGYGPVVRKLEAECFAVRARNEHGYAAQVITKAFDCVPRTDVRERATLHYVRAFMRIRALEVPEGLLDLAGMIELDPLRIPDFCDELMQVPKTIDLDSLLQTAAERIQDREPDPDFFAGFSAFVKLDFTKQHHQADDRSRIARQGIAALGRFLERAPLHPTGLVLRSFLRTHAGDLTGAARDARTLLEVAPTLGAGEFALARVYLARRDRDAALARVEAALRGRFFAWTVLDRWLEGIDDPRFPRAIGLARGAETLDFLAKVNEQLPNRHGEDRAYALTEGVDACRAGLRALAPLVKAGVPEARRLAVRIRLGRAHLLGLQEDHPAAARDLVAAFEVAPEALGVFWGDVVATGRALASSGWDRKMAPAGTDEPEPSGPFARAGRDLPFALARPGSRAGSLEGRGPAAAALRSVLKLAAGDDAGALSEARDEALVKVAPATADLLAARCEAVRKKPDEALRLLRSAVGAGVRAADLRDDWAFERLRDSAGFRELGR